MGLPLSAARRDQPASLRARLHDESGRLVRKKVGNEKNASLIELANGWEPLGSETLSGIDFLRQGEARSRRGQ